MLAICTSRSRSSASAGKSRIQQNIGKQIQAGCKIAAQHLHIHAKAVVAAIAVNVAADGFDFARDIPGITTFRAFKQHLGGKFRDAVVLRIFRKNAALECGSKFDEWQAMIFLHEQAQTVRQFNFLNRLVTAPPQYQPKFSARCHLAAAHKACDFPA